MTRILLLGAVLAAAPAGYAQVSPAPDTLDLSGTTVGAAYADLPAFGSTSSACTLTGQPEPYQPHLFHVDTDTVYAVSVVEPIDVGAGDDTVLLLYQTTFDPDAGCSHFVAIGNETPGSGLTASLSSADTYALVVVGFLGSEDAYTVRITGPEGSRVTEGALPVELTAFTAVQDGSALLLSWMTASETNNAGFSIEQQGAAQAWHEVRFVAGAGTTAEASRYAERLPAPAPGAYRFRLRQVDFDGAFAYSPEVEVAVQMGEAYRFGTPHPNPATDKVLTTLAVREAQHVRVTVYDAAGREVAILLDAAVEGSASQTLALDTSGWPSGLYLLRATGETFQATQRLTVVR